MYTREQRDQILADFRENAAQLTDAEKYPRLNADIVEVAQDNDTFSDWLKITLKNAVEAQIPLGAPLPELTIRNSVTEIPSLDAALISLTVSPKKSSPVAFNKESFKRSDKDTNSYEIVDFLVDAYVRILYTLMENANLEKLNDVLAWATSEEQADRKYSVSFIPSTLRERQSGFINTISDDELILVADSEAVFSLPEWVILADEDEEVSEKRIEDARQGLVASLIAHDTVVSLLHAKVPVIKILAGIGTHRTHTLIRKAFGRDAEGMNSKIKKSVLALVETDDVIGAVEYNNGEVSVVLSPVSKDTLEPVEFNIVELAKSYIAE